MSRTSAGPCGELGKLIGRRIRWIRSIQQMTLQELDAKTGIAHKLIARYEMGLVPIAMNAVERIAEALKIDPLRLCGQLSDFAWLVQEQVATIEDPKRFAAKPGEKEDGK